MKQSFTKLFVAFLALLLAPNSLWAQTHYGVFITKADGTEIEITSSNKADVLGNGDKEITFSNSTASYHQLYIKKNVTIKSIRNGYAEDDTDANHGLNISVDKDKQLTVTSPIMLYRPTGITGKGIIEIISSEGANIQMSAGKGYYIGTDENDYRHHLILTNTGNAPCISAGNGATLEIRHSSVEMTTNGTAVIDGISLSAENFVNSRIKEGAANSNSLSIVYNLRTNEKFKQDISIGDNTITLEFQRINADEDEVRLSGIEFPAEAENLDLTIPSGVTDPTGYNYIVTAIGPYAVCSTNGFLTLECLKSITLPSTITSIEGSAFVNITNLQSVTINSVCQQSDFIMDESAFNQVTSGEEGTELPVTLNLPENWTENVSTEWGGGIWQGTKVADIIVVGSRLKKTVNITATQEGDVAGTLELSFCVTKLATETEDGEVALYKKGELGVDIETWGNAAYSNPSDEDVKGSLVIPSYIEDNENKRYNVTTIGANAFYALNTNYEYIVCPHITSVTIPATVTNIYELAFANCPLSTVTFLGPQIKEIDENPMGDNRPFVGVTGATLNVPTSWGKVYSDWNGGQWEGLDENIKYPIQVVIQYKNDFDMWETREITVMSKNSENVCEGDERNDGKVSYNPTTKVLTVKEGAVLNIANGLLNEDSEWQDGVEDLTIYVEGDAEFSTIDLNRSTTISGHGKMTFEDGEGFMFHSNCTLTIRKADVYMREISYPISIEASYNPERMGKLIIDNSRIDIEVKYDVQTSASPFYALDSEPQITNCAISSTSPTINETDALTWFEDSEDYHSYYKVGNNILRNILLVPHIESDLYTEVADGSVDDIMVDLALAPGETDKVVISAVTTGDNATGAVVIPQTVTASDNAEYTVTGIAANAFQGQTNIESVSLPKTVTSIGENAFAGCTNMTSLTVQSPFVPTIGTGAFDANANLTVNYPAAAYDNYNDAGWTGVTFQPTVMQPNEWSTICSTQDYTLPEGIEAYIVVGIDYENSKVQVKKENGIKAGTPMMIHKTGVAEDYAVTVSNITISDTGEQLPATVATANEKGAFVGFAPTTADETLPIPNGSGAGNTQAYILVGNSFVRWTSGTLAPYRCFLWAVNAFTASSRMAIEIVDEEATGISDALRLNDNGEMNKVYDLQGRRVTNTAKKGVYIVDGKKIIK